MKRSEELRQQLKELKELKEKKFNEMVANRTDPTQEGEIVFEKRVWNNRRAVFYEVGEGLRDGLEEEEKIYIRTFDYDTAKQAFEVERDRLLEDDSFFLKDEEPDAEQSFDFGYAKIRYENDDGDFYELYLRQVEVEEEGRNYK